MNWQNGFFPDFFLFCFLFLYIKLLRWKTTIYHELTQMLDKREKLIEIKFRVFFSVSD